MIVAGGCGGSSNESSKGSPFTTSELSALARSRPFPIYWAGGRAGATYGLTRAGNGGFQVRYTATKAGALTVGTYPIRDPVSAVRRAALTPGTRLVRLPHGGVGTLRGTTDLHFAYPGGRVEVELFDPAGRTIVLVRAGLIRPIPH
jgi:hypothetical protein